VDDDHTVELRGASHGKGRNPPGFSGDSVRRVPPPWLLHERVFGVSWPRPTPCRIERARSCVYRRSRAGRQSWMSQQKTGQCSNCTAPSNRPLGFAEARPESARSVSEQREGQAVRVLQGDLGHLDLRARREGRAGQTDDPGKGFRRAAGEFEATVVGIAVQTGRWRADETLGAPRRPSSCHNLRTRTPTKTGSGESYASGTPLSYRPPVLHCARWSCAAAGTRRDRRARPRIPRRP
jgi:hypothetical protein